MKQLNLLPNTKYHSDSTHVNIDIYYFTTKQRRDVTLKRLHGRTPISSYSKRKGFQLEVRNGFYTTPNFDVAKTIVFTSHNSMVTHDAQSDAQEPKSTTFKKRKRGKKVLIASLVASDQDRWLKRFLTAIDNLDYPNKSYAFLVDNTKTRVFRILTKFKRTHPRVQIVEFETNFPLPRFSKLALLRNVLISSTLNKEDYILMIDSDIVSIPSNLLQQLMSDSDICAPLVLIEHYREFGNGYFYDRLAYIYKGKNFNHFYPYLSGETELPNTFFDVDSVGTCYLCNTDIFKNGVWFNSNRNISEQISFCSEARKRGYRVCLHPNVSVLHCNFEKYGSKFKGQ